ncbi:MAG: HAD family hydrolase [Vicingaceae bacterium]
MLLDNIKLNIKNTHFNTIIFDLNGTITNSVSNKPKHILFRNDYIEDKIGMPLYGALPDQTSKALDFYMLNTEEYYRYRNSVIDWNIFHSYNNTTFDILSSLHKSGYNLVLYTDCYMEQVEPTLEILGIKSFFKLIISRELGYKKPSTKAFRFISKTLGVSLNQLLMVANDYKQDLKPLRAIGGNIIWIKSEKNLKDAQAIIDKHDEGILKMYKSFNLEFT